ncbi:MAG: glycosyltransferase family 2 protein [Desulfocapsaceae bacterium]|jgi:glycosyltransferase involved in cell wall biosynthesis|nr:glycosyltransferase family 2 protein [Desulfocapsaceae bacterium]
MNPIVSVITPTHNSAAFLPETIEAILGQTFSDWELIIVDDCSSDASYEIARDYASRDARIKPVCLEQNGGAAVARNTAIEMAQGRFIAFCDSDDLWMPQKLEKQVEFMAEKDVAMSHTAYTKMREDGTRFKGVVPAKKIVSYHDLLKSCFIGCLTAMYDTKKVGKVFMPLIRKRQDYALWLRILKSGHVSLGLNEPLAIYRVCNNSVSSNKLIAAQYHWRVLREMEGLSLLKASYCFLHYAFLGFIKSRI